MLVGTSEQQKYSHILDFILTSICCWDHSDCGTTVSSGDSSNRKNISIYVNIIHKNRNHNHNIFVCTGHIIHCHRTVIDRIHSDTDSAIDLAVLSICHCINERVWTIVVFEGPINN